MDILYHYYSIIVQELGLNEVLSIFIWQLFLFLLTCFTFFIISTLIMWIEKKLFMFINNKKEIIPIKDLPINNFKESLLSSIIILAPILYLLGYIPYSNKYIPINAEMSTMLFLSILMFLLYAFLLLGKNDEYKKLEIKTIVAILSFFVPIFISLLAIIISTQTFSLNETVLNQSIISNSGGWLITPHILGFLVFLSGIICILTLLEKKLKIDNFCLLKIDNNKIKILLLCYYAFIFLLAAYVVCLYLGGYLPPLGFYLAEVYQINYVLNTSVVYLEQIFWFLLKTILLVIFIISFKIHFSDIKKKKLINFSWYILFPISIINLLICLILPFIGGN